VYRRGIVVAQLRPVHAARTRARRGKRSGVVLGQGADGGLGAQSGRADTIRDDLDARLAKACAGAIERLVTSVEVRRELGGCRLIETPTRDGNLHLVDLSLVAHVGGPGDGRRLRCDAFLLE